MRRIVTNVFDGFGRDVTPQRQRMVSKLPSGKSNPSTSDSMNSTFVSPKVFARSRAISSI